ncbi:MAG: sigma-54-dependent Fis family transcriptional regulator, partial [Candidatus Riflebacteria bacterium]|nr:sigma-54-dependent Fis family transcriptional regulator [Candidatus Riflebacteria bacterium]
KRVVEGRFREDLFYRLNVIKLTLPHLRERVEDIIQMANDFLAYFCHTNHKKPLSFTKETEQLLISYAWPGNIRELRNMVERAVILGTGEKIEKSDLPGSIIQAGMSTKIGDKVALATIEKLHIKKVIAGTTSLQEAADILEIDQATLWRKRKNMGI